MAVDNCDGTYSATFHSCELDQSKLYTLEVFQRYSRYFYTYKPLVENCKCSIADHIFTDENYVKNSITPLEIQIVISNTIRVDTGTEYSKK
jgi:hypothetical protein